MRLVTNHSLVMAEKILKLTRKLLTKQKLTRGYAPTVYAWSNGREDGFRVEVITPNGHPWNYAVAQDRHSDGIVIWVYAFCDLCTGHPEDWDKADDVRFKTVEEAATYLAIEIAALLC